MKIENISKKKNFSKSLTIKIIIELLISLKTTCSLFSRLKDRISPRDESNIVYRIPCLDCQKCYSWWIESDKTNMIVKIDLKIWQGWLLCPLTGLRKAIASIFRLLRISIKIPTRLEEILVKWFTSNLMTLSIIYNYRVDTQNLRQMYSNILTLYKNRNHYTPP